MKPARAPARCGFLFNHDQLHQMAHSAPIAFELMQCAPELQVSLLATTPAQYERLRQWLLEAGLPLEGLELIRLPTWLRAAAGLLDPLLPFSRVATLLAHSERFRALDLLVAPEKTSLLLRKRPGLDKLKFVHTRHGAGDREVGFDRHSGEFDLVLMSGPKIRDRLRARGLLREGGHAIVGYPKFDLCAATRAPPRLFDNDRPTVLYNPHCSPFLSSWFEDGLAVLEAFYHSERYNLIFAPHVMLFAKRLQVSLKPLRLDRPGSLPQRYLDCPHMLIDLGSERSSDMSYTEAADLYLGDVSSQIYEFLRRPRPCVFIDSHGRDWLGDDNYQHWRSGPVLRGVEGLMPTLAAAFDEPGEYATVQRSLFDHSIALTETPSSRRAAQAIVDFVQRELPAAGAQPDALSGSFPDASSDPMRATAR